MAVVAGRSTRSLGGGAVGIEALVPVVLLLGVVLFVFLVARSFDAAARPYTLPTLLAAIGFAAFLNSHDGHAPGFFWSSLIAWFALGGVVFGILAHAIRWLVRRQGRRGSAS
jgi:hypothetical protein